MEEIKEKENCSCEQNCHCEEKKDESKQCECTDEHIETKEKRKEKKHKEIEKLQEELEKVKQEKTELLAKIQYSQAELINYRKRKEEETMKSLKYANQSIISEIILVLDNFERAIKLDDNNLSDELSKFLQGFKMMYANLVDILKKFGVKEIECLHQPFNPNQMEALMMDSDENFTNDEVLEVLLKGYMLHDRVIRPASVKVNKLEESKGEE